MLKRLFWLLSCLILIQLSLSCAPAPKSAKSTSQGSSNGLGGGNNGGGNNGGSGNNGGNNNPPPPSPEEQYFDTNIAGTFNSGRCISCHAEPRNVTGVRAPLTIYDYNAMKSLLSDGVSPSNNALINRMQGVPSHTGGNQCAGGVGVSPCKEVVDWYKYEFKTTDNGFSGFIDDVSVTGTVHGWAKDPIDNNKILTVFFYMNGPVGQGTLVGSTMANELGPGGPGFGHYFNFPLSAQYADGSAKNLYVYIEQAMANNIMPGMPKTYIAYTPKQAGRNFYINNLYNPATGTGAMTRCQGCHSLDYDTQYFNLLVPTPFNGGSATNNSIVRKGSGQDMHGGGNRCGGINGSPCNLIQQWWNIEFN